MDTSVSRKIGCGVLGLIILAAIGAGWWIIRGEWIPSGHIGIISGPGGLRPGVIKPSRVVVPWQHRLLQYPTREEVAVFSKDPDEGEIRSGDAIQVTTAGNMNLAFNVTVSYRVEPENAEKVFKTFGGLPIKEIERQHIRGAVREACNIVGPRHETFALMGPELTLASKELLQEVRLNLESKGLTIISAYFQDADPGDLKARTIGRINATTGTKTAQIENEIAKIQKQITIAKAEGESKAQRISSGTASARSLEIEAWDSVLLWASKWKGNLVKHQTKNASVYIPLGPAR